MCANDGKPFTRRRGKCGFTLVELLVVIAIIGILVALLLPAVNSAREAARRMNCMNNIRNLALALLNYESSYKAFPASNQGVTRGAVVNMYAGQQLSWITQILPFLEEQALYDRFDFDLSVFEQDPTFAPESAQPSVLLCPSDAAATRFYASSRYSNGRRLAKGNYAAYAGPEHVICQRVFRGSLIFEPQPLKRFKDGLTKTIMLSEVRTRAREDDQRGAWALAWTGSTLLSLDVHSATTGGSACDPGTELNVGYIPDPDFFELAQPPNNPPGRFNQDQLRECNDASEADLLGMPCVREKWQSAAPRSLHPGGVNACHGDASILFISDDIDLKLFAQLICINDGLATSGAP